MIFLASYYQWIFITGKCTSIIFLQCSWSSSSLPALQTFLQSTACQEGEGKISFCLSLYMSLILVIHSVRKENKFSYNDFRTFSRHFLRTLAMSMTFQKDLIISTICQKANQCQTIRRGKSQIHMALQVSWILFNIYDSKLLYYQHVELMFVGGNVISLIFYYFLRINTTLLEGSSYL